MQSMPSGKNFLIDFARVIATKADEVPNPAFFQSLIPVW
jgi:hypothetical protein